MAALRGAGRGGAGDLMLGAGLAVPHTRDTAEAERHGRGAGQAVVLRGRRSRLARAPRAERIR
jgi:hypothetical protein